MFSDNYDGTFIGTTDKCNARNFKPDAAGLFYYGAAKICCKKILGNAYHIRMGKIYNLSDLYNHCPDCTSDKFWNSGKWSSEKYIDLYRIWTTGDEYYCFLPDQWYIEAGSTDNREPLIAGAG